MEKEILEFINQNNLSPFGDKKSIRASSINIFKTLDAKSIHSKVLNEINCNFEFDNSASVWGLFGFTNNREEIKKRQDFFKSLKKENKDFLKKIVKPRSFWKPRYNVIVVTENEETFMELKRGL